MVKKSKFDEQFEVWIYHQIKNIRDVDAKKWAHALAYTGGIEPEKGLEYENKLGWMISGSPLMTSYMRHQMHVLADHLEVPVSYKGDPSKLVKPRTFKALGINIIRILRERYYLFTVELNIFQ
jgi:hypothetical protein